MLEIEIKKEDGIQYEFDVSTMYRIDDICDVCLKGRSEYWVYYVINQRFIVRFLCVKCYYESLEEAINYIKTSFSKLSYFKILTEYIYLRFEKTTSKSKCSKCGKDTNYLIVYANNSNPTEFSLCQNCLYNLLLSILNQI